jgi:hypothetical protein
MIFSVIVILRENALSTGIFDMFFLKYLIIRFLAKREFICLKIAQIFNWINMMILTEVRSSIPYLV